MQSTSHNSFEVTMHQQQMITPAENAQPFESFPEQLQHNARTQPHKTALVYEGHRIDWATFHQRVRLIAGRLVAAGIGNYDKVAMLAHNCPEYVEMFAAALHVGACAVPLSSMASGEALEGM